MRRAGKLVAALATALVAACSSSGETLLAQGEQQPGALAAQAGTVYWLEQATASAPAGLRTVSTKGGTPTTLSAVATPRALALSASEAIIGTSSGNVYGVALAGGGPTVLIPSLGDASVQVAARGDSAFAAFNSSRIARVTISAGINSVMELDSADNAVTTMVADDLWLYWGTSSGEVFRQLADGSGSAVKLGTLSGTPIASAISAGAAYFATKLDVTQISETAPALVIVLSFSSSCPPPRACTFSIWGLASSSAGLFVGLTHGVAKLDPGTGDTPIIAALNINGTSLAADANGVYWIAGAQASTGQQALSNAIYGSGL
jgi:hypothetical protein